MTRPLEGFKVVEVSMWGFVPTAGVTLADWGADVVKIEHPIHGDPARGVLTSSWQAGKNGVRFLFEMFNRGKRCVALDLGHPDGREVLYRMVGEADVFLTSLRESSRRRMGIDATELRGRFPSLVYASGSGFGTEGPDFDEGGYDLSAYWARGGVADRITPRGSEFPIDMPTPGFGDIPSGTMLAGGIAAALVKKLRSGEGSTIDLSLLNTAMWSIAAEITGTDALDVDRFYRGDGRVSGNPTVAVFRTKDDRFVQLVITEGDKHWADLCRRIGRPDLADDDRFAKQDSRRANAAECLALLEEAFASRTVEEWREALQGASGQWAVVQTPREVPFDPQVQANGYAQTRHDREGREYLSVVSPVRSVGEPVEETRPAPGHGEHTDEVLLELGYTWDELITLKLDGAIL